MLLDSRPDSQAAPGSGHPESLAWASWFKTVSLWPSTGPVPPQMPPRTSASLPKCTTYSQGHELLCVHRWDLKCRLPKSTFLRMNHTSGGQLFAGGRRIKLEKQGVWTWTRTPKCTCSPNHANVSCRTAGPLACSPWRRGQVYDCRGCELVHDWHWHVKALWWLLFYQEN